MLVLSMTTFRWDIRAAFCPRGYYTLGTLDRDIDLSWPYTDCPTRFMNGLDGWSGPFILRFSVESSDCSRFEFYILSIMRWYAASFYCFASFFDSLTVFRVGDSSCYLFFLVDGEADFYDFFDFPAGELFFDFLLFSSLASAIYVSPSRSMFSCTLTFFPTLE